MKKAGLLMLLVGLVAVGFFAASPYMALGGLRTAMEEGDAADLGDRVDFPSVREGLKAELNGKLMQEVGKDVSDNPFGVLAIGFASKLVDGLVDSAVTPVGLARMAAGDDQPISGSPKGGRPGDPPPKDESEVFRNSRLERDNLSRFSVYVPNDDGEELRFVFSRRGFDWVLTAVKLPESFFANVN